MKYRIILQNTKNEAINNSDITASTKVSSFVIDNKNLKMIKFDDNAVVKKDNELSTFSLSLTDDSSNNNNNNNKDENFNDENTFNDDESKSTNNKIEGYETLVRNPLIKKKKKT